MRVGGGDMANKKRVLIVDDERHTREALIRYLSRRFEVTGAEDGAVAIERLKSEDFDIVLTDLRMPGADGMGVLEATQSKAKRPICVVFTAYGSIESSVEAVKAGAFDFVTKPVKLDKLDLVIEAALEQLAESEMPAVIIGEGGQSPLTSSGQPILGDSKAMHKVLDLVRTVASSKINILLTGESGTGKEVIARAIHDASGRAGLFVPVHCAALATNLLESELFGHEKGAFTGANNMRRGRFELAEGGTIFLDEIGEIDSSIQVKLLRVLETRTIERIGGNESISYNGRIVAATNRDLGAMVREGTFREDLYYRLEGVTITMPPLRERREDIPELVLYFMRSAAEENERDVRTISREAMERLCGYSWPGNIRELRHCMERMVVLATGPELSCAELPESITKGEALMVTETVELAEVSSLVEGELELIKRALNRNGGNRTKAAAELGISRRTLHRRLHEYNLV